jgi:hypothetical protein
MASSQQDQDHVTEGLGLVIELEWDPIKNQQLGQTFSRPTEEQHPNDDSPPSNIEAGAAAGSGSYLAICPTTIQSLGSGQTLFVWQAKFHPGIGRRFKNAIVAIKFSLPQSSDTSSPSLKPPTVTAHAPRKAFGNTTEESKTFTWSLEIPISGGLGVTNVGVTPQVSSEASKKVEHAFTIIGTARGSPQKTTCVWTLEENNSSERGLPSEVQFALLVEHQGSVSYEVDVRGETGGGLYPPHWLRAKSDATERRKVLDPSKYGGKLHEYYIPDAEKLQQLLATWTGEVEGALIRFTQPTIRP